MRLTSSVKGDYLRAKYDVIIGWGAKKEFLAVYNEEILQIDILVDGKNNNVGNSLKGVVVQDISVIRKYRDSKNILVVIYPNIEDEIIQQIKTELPNADTVCARLVKSDYFKSSYSSNGEDRIMFDYISGITNNITYVDIGVCHPVTRNNTFLFYDMGYKNGLLIEPNVFMCDLAHHYRPENRIANCGVSGNQNDKILKYYYREHAPGLNTFKYEWTLAHNGAEWKVREVPVVNINNILAENFTDRQISVVDIDTEGMDFELLTALDTNYFNIEMICVEKSSLFDINTLMKNKGYKILDETKENYIYISEKRGNVYEF